MLDQLIQSPETQISYGALLLNLGIGIIFSLLLSWHFKTFASTFSNRNELAQVFPFILLTTILIITVVKSSLALSLGLVGALSIVRFRTPIKEPEELAYLFIAIAIGLGLGANQTTPTVLASSIILVVGAGLTYVRRTAENKNLYLSIDWNDGKDEMPPSLDHLNEVISNHTVTSDLRRFDVRNGCLETCYFIDLKSPVHLTQLTDQLKSRFPNIGVTFIDQNQMPHV